MPHEKAASKITEKDIEKLALLARIKIGDDEKAKLVKEMDSILAYVDTIKKATINSNVTSKGEAEDDTEGRIAAVKNVNRTDEPRTLSHNDRERILAGVPDRESDFVAVKKIL